MPPLVSSKVLGEVSANTPALTSARNTQYSASSWDPEARASPPIGFAPFRSKSGPSFAVESSREGPGVP